MTTVHVWKPLAVGIVGLLLGAGCGWFWQGVAAFAAYRCELVIHEPLGDLCPLNVVIYYPVAIVVAAMVSFGLMAAALAALRVRSHAVYATPSIVVVAALVYHTAGAGKIALTAAVLGFGVSCVVAVEEWLSARSRRL